MNKYIKLLIALLIIVLGIYLITLRQTGWGIILIVLSIIPIFLFFRNEYIWLAFWQIRKQNVDGAAKWLNNITSMEKQLVRKQYGYYTYLLALSQQGTQENIARTEQLMKKALDYGLSFDHDKAMAYLSLAVAVISKGKKQEGEKYLSEAKRLDKQGMLTEQIKLIKEQTKRMNIGKNMINPQMRQRGKFF